MLSPSHQFGLLVEAVEREFPARAAELSHYSYEAQQGLLAHLVSMVSRGNESDTAELWRVSKDNRVLTCIARYLPTGVDLLVFQNGELRRSQLCPTGPDARTLATLWLAALEKSGWSQVPQS